jgi:hypothetical protein
MFQSSGKLKYSIDPIKLILQVDRGISDYYASTVPKYIKLKRQAFPAHISVVRNATPPNMEFWNKYDGNEINFQYENYIYNDNTYYWLNCYSVELENIRSELGLQPYGDVTLSPDFKHRFHITIGNVKSL